MSVTDGQPVNAAITNAAFVSRTADSNTTGKVDLENVDAASGSSVTNVQRELNGLDSLITDTPTTNGTENRKFTYASDAIGSANQGLKERMDSVQAVVETNQTSLAGKIDKVTSTDEGVVRYNGTSGDVQDSGVTIDDSNNMIIPGNLTVNGTTTTVGTATLDVTDANITVNDGGNQATADSNDAGITVEMSDATDAIIGYDSTLASRFAIGEVGSTAEIADVSSAQVITNKDIDGGTASNTTRITVPKDTEANLTSLTRKEATIVYASDSNKFLVDNGTTLDELSVAGVTSTEDPKLLQNLGLQTSVAANALTIDLRQKDGSSAPGAGTGAVKIAFRNNSITTTQGGFSVVSATSATAITVSSTATLGHADATDCDIFVYALNNAGTIELAVSSTLQDETILQSTTVMGVSADFGNLYSTTARSNVAIRLLGKVVSNQTTAGTWAANTQNVTLASTDSLFYEDRFLAATSSVKTPTGSGNWQQMTGNSIELLPGRWKIFGFVEFTDNGTTANYSEVAARWCTANGADNATAPTATTIQALEAGLPLDVLPDSATLRVYRHTVSPIRKNVTQAEDLFLVPFAVMTTSANARIEVRLYAERID